MRYDVYYALYDRGQSVASDNPVSMEPDAIAGEILAAMDGDGDYMGVLDSDGTALQFVYEQEEDRFWVEIPLLDQRASHGCQRTYEQCVALLKDLPGTFKLQAFPDFAYYPWQNP